MVKFLQPIHLIIAIAVLGNVEKNGVVKKCKICKKEFYVKLSHQSQQCCSAKCYHISRKGDIPWNKGLKKATNTGKTWFKKGDKGHLTHGMSGTKFNTIWQGMKQRCFYKNNDNYKYYGGRGITVCKRWLKFENFKDDMYESYKEHKLNNDYTSIDRTDNNGNYEFNNCKWATRKEQCNNRRLPNKS